GVKPVPRALLTQRQPHHQQRRVHHRSKPGMARGRGGRRRSVWAVTHIPVVIRQLFKRLVAQARGQG
ncbi:hypothetical protein, partial [Aeromonas molluscorum]